MTVIPLRPEGEVRTLRIEQIRHDPRTQPRNHVDDDVVERYRDCLLEGDEFPPITVFFDGTDYWNADGWHRVTAHKRAGRAEIVCEIRPGTLRDAEWHSFSVNAKHGYARSGDDVERILNRIFFDPEWSKKGFLAISRHTHIPETTVRRRYGKLISNTAANRKSGETPPAAEFGIKSTVREVETRDGRRYEIETGGIGRQTHIEEFCPPRAMADWRAKVEPEEERAILSEDPRGETAFGYSYELEDSPRERSCATCVHMHWINTFDAYVCAAYEKETGPDNVAGYSCPSWVSDHADDEPAAVEPDEDDGDDTFAFKAFPPEHAKPAGRIRFLIEQLYQELALSPADAARAYPWKWARPELSDKSAAVSQWLSQFAKELEP